MGLCCDINHERDLRYYDFSPLSSMPLSVGSLYPLTATSVQFTYCLDHPLQSIATRYELLTGTSTKRPGRQCTLLVAEGVSLNQETWVPTIKHLYCLADDPTIDVNILSVWVIERPNHGDAAILNRKKLQDHYSDAFPGAQYGACIRQFLSSNILSPQEKQCLIGVGHSGGGGSILHAMHPITSNFPFRALILVETPHCGMDAQGWWEVLFKGVTRSNARRPRDWASKEEAMQWIRTHPPWKTLHSDVLAIIDETYFIPHPERPGRLTVKTTVEQEQACFVHDDIWKMGLPYIRAILRRLPLHSISGSVQDIWPPQMYETIHKNMDEDRADFASVVTIQGASHYIPAQKPQELAAEIARILAIEGTIIHSKL